MILSFFNKVLPIFLGMFSIVLLGQITTLSFGSCHKMDKPNSDVILKTIAAEKPDGFIWLGDIVYGNDGNSKDLKTKFDRLSNKAAYQNLKKNTKVYGIWDDHDYGINDGGADYVNKSESRRDLFTFLGLPKDHRAYQREGAYQAYTIQANKQHIKMILLDNRYFKTPYVKSKNNRQQYRKDRKGTLLGKAQWAWLEKQLKNSNAKVHVFGCGIQLLSNKHRFEKWSNYPKERKKMFRLLQKYKVKNPIFLTGDRHMSELSIANIGYTSLIDATSSGMTEALTYNLTEENPYRVGPTIGQNSYGQLIIDWDQSRISILFKNSEGIPLYEYQQDLMKH
jgi:alkaline phosphatase D